MDRFNNVKSHLSSYHNYVRVQIGLSPSDAAAAAASGALPSAFISGSRGDLTYDNIGVIYLIPPHHQGTPVNSTHNNNNNKGSNKTFSSSSSSSSSVVPSLRNNNSNNGSSNNNDLTRITPTRELRRQLKNAIRDLKNCGRGSGSGGSSGSGRLRAPCIRCIIITNEGNTFGSGPFHYDFSDCLYTSFYEKHHNIIRKSNDYLYDMSKIEEDDYYPSLNELNNYIENINLFRPGAAGAIVPSSSSSSSSNKPSSYSSSSQTSGVSSNSAVGSGGGGGTRGSKIMVISAIQGFCSSWGLSLALSSTYRVASFFSTFSSPENSNQYYLIPVGGVVFRCLLLLGMNETCRLLLTSKVINSKHALRIGLIDKIIYTHHQQHLPAAVTVGGGSSRSSGNALPATVTATGEPFIRQVMDFALAQLRDLETHYPRLLDDATFSSLRIIPYHNSLQVRQRREETESSGHHGNNNNSNKDGATVEKREKDSLKNNDSAVNNVNDNGDGGLSTTSSTTSDDTNNKTKTKRSFSSPPSTKAAAATSTEGLSASASASSSSSSSSSSSRNVAIDSSHINIRNNRLNQFSDVLLLAWVKHRIYEDVPYALRPYYYRLVHFISFASQQLIIRRHRRSRSAGAGDVSGSGVNASGTNAAATATVVGSHRFNKKLMMNSNNINCTFFLRGLQEEESIYKKIIFDTWGGKAIQHAAKSIITCTDACLLNPAHDPAAALSSAPSPSLANNNNSKNNNNNNSSISASPSTLLATAKPNVNTNNTHCYSINSGNVATAIGGSDSNSNITGNANDSGGAGVGAVGGVYSDMASLFSSEQQQQAPDSVLSAAVGAEVDPAALLPSLYNLRHYPKIYKTVTVLGAGTMASSLAVLLLFKLVISQENYYQCHIFVVEEEETSATSAFSSSSYSGQERRRIDSCRDSIHRYLLKCEEQNKISAAHVRMAMSAMSFLTWGEFASYSDTGAAGVGHATAAPGASSSSSSSSPAASARNPTAADVFFVCNAVGHTGGSRGAHPGTAAVSSPSSSSPSPFSTLHADGPTATYSAAAANSNSSSAGGVPSAVSSATSDFAAALAAAEAATAEAKLRTFYRIKNVCRANPYSIFLLCSSSGDDVGVLSRVLNSPGPQTPCVSNSSHRLVIKRCVYGVTFYPSVHRDSSLVEVFVNNHLMAHAAWVRHQQQCMQQQMRQQHGAGGAAAAAGSPFLFSSSSSSSSVAPSAATAAAGMGSALPSSSSSSFSPASASVAAAHPRMVNTAYERAVDALFLEERVFHHTVSAFFIFALRKHACAFYLDNSDDQALLLALRQQQQQQQSYQQHHHQHYLSGLGGAGRVMSGVLGAAAAAAVPWPYAQQQQHQRLLGGLLGSHQNGSSAVVVAGASGGNGVVTANSDSPLPFGYDYAGVMLSERYQHTMLCFGVRLWCAGFYQMLAMLETSFFAFEMDQKLRKMFLFSRTFFETADEIKLNIVYYYLLQMRRAGRLPPHDGPLLLLKRIIEQDLPSGRASSSSPAATSDAAGAGSPLAPLPQLCLGKVTGKGFFTYKRLQRNEIGESNNDFLCRGKTFSPNYSVFNFFKNKKPFFPDSDDEEKEAAAAAAAASADENGHDSDDDTGGHAKHSTSMKRGGTAAGGVASVIRAVGSAAASAVTAFTPWGNSAAAAAAAAAAASPHSSSSFSSLPSSSSFAATDWEALHFSSEYLQLQHNRGSELATLAHDRVHGIRRLDASNREIFDRAYLGMLLEAISILSERKYGPGHGGGGGGGAGAYGGHQGWHSSSSSSSSNINTGGGNRRSGSGHNLISSYELDALSVQLCGFPSILGGVCYYTDYVFQDHNTPNEPFLPPENPSSSPLHSAASGAAGAARMAPGASPSLPAARSSSSSSSSSRLERLRGSVSARVGGGGGGGGSRNGAGGGPASVQQAKRETTIASARFNNRMENVLKVLEFYRLGLYHQRVFPTQVPHILRLMAQENRKINEVFP